MEHQPDLTEHCVNETAKVAEFIVFTTAGKIETTVRNFEEYEEVLKGYGLPADREFYNGLEWHMVN
jgi:hypothetical protein